MALRGAVAFGLVLGVCAGLGACGDAPAAQGEVVQSDSSGPDLGVDSASNSDIAPDSASSEPDALVADTVPDTAVDTSIPDGTPDTPADTTPDTSPDTTDAPDPAAVGPLGVTREEVEVAGFDAVLFVPTGVAPAPAIVLAPGFQLDGSAFAGYGEHLASHGIAVLIPTFGDSLFAPISHNELADDFVVMVTWLAADSRIDATRIGAAGHSRGGKIAILATTRSTAIKALFGLDPVDTVGGPGAQPSPANPSVTPERMAAVIVPFAVLGSAYGGTAASAFAPACAPVEDNYHQYALAAGAAPVVYEWLAPASGHNDFADPLPFLLSFACQAGDDPAATRTLAKARLVAFFKRHLEGDQRYALP